MVRWCWVNFQCRGVLLIWLIVGQGPIALAAGAVGFFFDIFLPPLISLFFLPLPGTARYRLKYCLKEPLSPQQPTNQSVDVSNDKAIQAASNCYKIITQRLTDMIMLFR